MKNVGDIQDTDNNEILDEHTPPRTRSVVVSPSKRAPISRLVSGGVLGHPTAPLPQSSVSLRRWWSNVDRVVMRIAIVIKYRESGQPARGCTCCDWEREGMSCHQ
jgi:hypothetical protein